jgi:hypothetical protein
METVCVHISDFRIVEHNSNGIRVGRQNRSRAAENAVSSGKSQRGWTIREGGA